MAQKKAYSRYFIILQQDESGYSLSSDKIPSGYTKLETKNDKCKISYYVQNLKKEMEPYYMLLICSKKDVKKLIKLGIMNIDEHGRAEVTYEYGAGNISESGIGIENVTGAAVIKAQDNDMISVMSGFASADVPGDWRTYEVYDNSRSQVEEEIKEEIIETANVMLEENKETAEIKAEVGKEKQEENNNIFDIYEAKIEETKQQPLATESRLDKLSTESDKDVILESKDVLEAESKEIVQTEDNILVETHSNQNIEIDYVETRKEEKTSEAEKIDIKDNDEIKKEQKISAEEEYPMGTVGEFFRILAEGFDEVKDACKEIKRCRWYRVNVNSLEDMCNSSNYNRYTLVYYPMMSYYPYIRKQGHYLMGYKYDATGKMKYIVYGIPGTRNISDQPYGGKSGFVTWVSLKDGEDRADAAGYWLMFYDFRTSTIVIPVK